MYFFTADEHYGHKNVVRYCDRPFSSVEEMDKTLISNHNKVVTQDDMVIHAGDFSLENFYTTQWYIKQLNGKHIFLRGSHDKWLPPKGHHEIWEKTIESQPLVVCHYAMRTWARSHYNSWHCFGHSHGRLQPEGKSWDIGVDNNGFYPVSFEQLKKIMSHRPDNFNLIRKDK